MSLPTRRPCITIPVQTDVDRFYATISFHPDTGAPCEVFMTGRGKVGQTLDSVLHSMGVAISKEMQRE